MGTGGTTARQQGAPLLQHAARDNSISVNDPLCIMSPAGYVNAKLILM
jgi:hypothetical protein